MNSINVIHTEWDNIAYDFSPVSASREFCPEEKLMFAIVIQAIDDATSRSVSPTIQSQARTAIFHTTASPLIDYCEFLGIDFRYLRDSVAKMIEEGRTVGKAKLFVGG